MPTTKTPARRTANRSKSKDTYDDLEVLSTDDEGLTFKAKIFDDPEPWVFSTDVNAWLQMSAFSGEPGAFNNFMYSLIHVEADDDEDERKISQRQFELKQRFNTSMSQVQNLSMERLVQFIIDITEVAGNARSQSSSG